MTASPDLATPAARPTIRGHIAIMRIDHWVKQVFVLPGILAALSDGTSDIPSGVVVRVVVGMASVCPVSYTHLRAHETPEHLVCRLLLEKKNATHV